MFWIAKEFQDALLSKIDWQAKLKYIGCLAMFHANSELYSPTCTQYTLPAIQEYNRHGTKDSTISFDFHLLPPAKRYEKYQQSILLWYHPRFLIRVSNKFAWFSIWFQLTVDSFDDTANNSNNNDKLNQLCETEHTNGNVKRHEHTYR